MNQTARQAPRWACLAATLVACVVAFGAFAQDLVPVPALRERVTDLTGTLSADRKATLDKALREFDERKGVQFAVLMVETTKPEPIEQYALRVVEQWKLGRRKVDDGALLLVAKADRAVRIEVGYGIEGVLNDLTARRIIDEEITPRFRAGDFDGGIAAGAERMMRVIDGEPLPAPREPRRSVGEGDLGRNWPVLFIVALVLGGFVRHAIGRLPGALVVGGVLGVVAWFAIGTIAVAAMAGLAGFVVTLLGIGAGGHGGHRHGGGSWPRGGGWSRGGGGFRGGGGGFGGGGSSGRW